MKDRPQLVMIMPKEDESFLELREMAGINTDNSVGRGVGGSGKYSKNSERVKKLRFATSTIFMA